MASAADWGQGRGRARDKGGMAHGERELRCVHSMIRRRIPCRSLAESGPGGPLASFFASLSVLLLSAMEAAL